MSECSGQKEINIGKNVTECFLVSNKTQYLHKDGWKRLLVETESLDIVAIENRVLLKVLKFFTCNVGRNIWGEFIS